ncbi:LytR C-terminal domain-containing protein [Arthrobacter sp. Br18]|uniref:LytR C-terminal domain-containing protein n=1 Tax=Arthrobacter sp. Br18 TaxID=1312954 RepID=UPI0004BA71B0|nr:LytR C-terminal domain-containing protein [Arthrobacter sp. Br18]
MPELPPRNERAEARRDPTEWHGHRIVTEADLGAVFADDDVETVHSPRPNLKKVLHGLVLVVLIGLLIIAVFLALAIQRGEINVGASEPTSGPTAPSCPAGPFDYQDPSAITVNVYNSTTINGLADTAAAQLRGRAFAVAAIGNRDAGGAGTTAVIVSGPDGAANAFTVQRTIPGSLYLSDERTDRTVDVVLGPEYGGIVPPEAVDITPAGLNCLEEAAGEPAPAGP